MSGARFVPIDATPGYQRVAEAIEQEILSGRFSPGDVLPTEAELSAQMKVHRSTVREGLRAMENAGLLRRSGARRLVVSVPSSNDIAWTTTRALSLSKTTFLELWEVQMVLEPFAAELAAERAPNEIIEALKDNLRNASSNLLNDQILIQLDVEFHQLVAQATLNRPLALASEPIGILLLSASQELYARAPRARERLLEAHQKIADAIETHDKATARLWMEKHIRDFYRGYKVAEFDMNAPVLPQSRTKLFRS
jgi:GntR family transcriptional repressor for pyruvate dehydrogenase complex